MLGSRASSRALRQGTQGAGKQHNGAAVVVVQKGAAEEVVQSASEEVQGADIVLLAGCEGVVQKLRCPPRMRGGAVAGDVQQWWQAG